MAARTLEIIPCPPPLVIDALALVLRDLTPEQRRELVPHSNRTAFDGLQIAVEDGDLRGAVWAQRQPGNTAILWPPVVTPSAGAEVTRQLCAAAAAALDASAVRMAQVLLPDRTAAIIPALETAGFHWLADLLYLNWETANVPNRSADDVSALEFEPYHPSYRQRLVALVEATYADTQDCAAMNGQRPMDEVLDGYVATGAHRPENWQFTRANGEDIGILLMADHSPAQHWELMYMGVVPTARGRRFGREIVRRAQQMAHAAQTARIVLAVDAANLPAIKMYGAAGFAAWDRRTVFVRFLR